MKENTREMENKHKNKICKNVYMENIDQKSKTEMEHYSLSFTIRPILLIKPPPPSCYILSLTPNSGTRTKMKNSLTMHNRILDIAEKNIQ